MSEFISLRGYGAVYGQPAAIDGVIEQVQRGAFRAQLRGAHRVYLNAFDHDGEPIATPVTLFSDQHGVGFVVGVRASVLNGMRSALARNPYCSIEMVNMRSENGRDCDGASCRHIVSAEITHITVATPSPAYRGTGVWPADQRDCLSPRLAELNAQWERGRALALEVERIRARIRARTAAPPRQRAPRVPAALSAFLAARQKNYERVRLGAARAFARGELNGATFGHAAFTKAAGFDGHEFGVK